MSEPLGLYIHIPFCHARCGYCDFVTFTDQEDKRGAYIEALCREMGLYSDLQGVILSGAKDLAVAFPETQRDSSLSAQNDVDTIFFGGGTPSVLEPEHIRSIFAALRKYFQINPLAEITLEANPESITRSKLEAWKAAGINRLSIGLQAYDNTLLKSMGRLHTVEEFCAAYCLARDAGFSNINIDLIYGFPGQTLETWKQTVTAAAGLKPEHLSLYSLTVEEHTPFAAQGAVVDADLQADMYDWARVYLPAQDFNQYEISNFARSGKECRHNLIYWRGQDYLGLGVGAVGCMGNQRWQNRKNMASYFKDVKAGRLPRESVEELNPATQKFERLMLGLRLREGYSWGTEENAEWRAHRERLATHGHLEEIHPGIWRIPDPYVPLTNQILLPFLG